MTDQLSPRLAAVADALPLRPGMRVLEIGSGPGALARELVRRGCEVVAIDRSERAHAIASRAGGGPDFRHTAIEDLVLADGEAPFALVVAVRVGALDGRHDAGPALDRIAAALAPDGRVFVERAGAVIEIDPPRVG
ncbi:class I SAM-dependent methyltransferase [Pseudactinotalea suaedae]|uniref:class I SAM-dependent methyltransferase n=1 Tax=Pseudactinotalea suaedae TaxID=1524924 RepID=UPI0012E2F662|nr:class I SAM-dependent methyltransferase [Pseudactinotalea suaedae]